MKKIYTLSLLLLAGLVSQAQASLTILPSGGNKKASVTEQVGLTTVNIQYDRPAVKGREGKIWGQLVPAGFTDPQFGSSKSSPWRAGANENTVITFSNDVKINGQALAAGQYGLFIAYDPAECTLIFSKNSSSWGHYYYDDKEDALRVKVKPQSADKSVEWLKYEFMDQQEAAATVALQWEKLSIPFTIETDYVRDQTALFRKELRSQKGFTWQSWNQAALWSVQRNTNLQEALLWADSATGPSFGGAQEFPAWTTKAQVLQKLGREQEAAAIMQKALPLGNMNEVHQYGRQLLGMKKNQEAFNVFKMNHDKYPKQFTTLAGMTRGYSAIGDYKNALKYANMALLVAPDELNRKSFESMIGKLKEGKDVN